MPGETSQSGMTLRGATALLNRTARRLREAGDAGEWSAALLDGASGFCGRAMVFLMEGETARMVRAVPERTPLDVPLADAPALAECVREREPLVVVWSASELSAALTRLLGRAITPRVYLFPVLSPTRTVALLMAEGEKEEIDVEALELLSLVGGQNLKALAMAPVTTSARPDAQVLISIQPARPAAALPPTPAAGAAEFVAAEERQVHLRAQRFARVRTAEMRLYQAERVQSGRAAANLYAALRNEIDRAREIFRREFLDRTTGMTDYLHVELLRTLANDNAQLLGIEYPGPLA